MNYGTGAIKRGNWLTAIGLLVFLVSPVCAQQASVSTQVFLPKTDKIAGEEEPPCENGLPDLSSIVIQGLGNAIDYFAIGQPIVSSLLQMPGVVDRVKGIFGLHNGKAACQGMCVVIPARASVVWEDACVADGYGRKCNSVQKHNNIFIDYYGGVRATASESVKADKKVVCVVAKNWSHDRDRIVSWRVWY